MHPIAFWFFFWGEFAERCSFYGMKAILLLYMIERLGFGNGTASRTVNYFKAACYFLPLAGGFLADHYFGKYRTIVAFSLPYILGHVILGFQNVPCLLFGLALLAMGAGAVKPNLSTLMGMTYDQQRPGQTQLRSDAFGMFYVAINTGSFVSSFAVPLIRNYYGYRIAFLFPAALMVVAFLLFVAGKPFYAQETIPRVRPTPRQRSADWPALRKILALFAVVIFFWSVLEQYDSTWILFARDHVDLNVFDFSPETWQGSVVAFLRDRLHIELLGRPLVADQFQALNPIFVMVMVPVVAVVWRLLARAGLPPPANRQDAHRVRAHAGHAADPGRGRGPRTRSRTDFSVVARHGLFRRYDRGSLYFGRRVGTGIYRRAGLDEGPRHGLLAADDVAGRHPQRVDYALLRANGFTGQPVGSPHGDRLLRPLHAHDGPRASRLPARGPPIQRHHSRLNSFFCGS